jgi:hypothetical protein
MSKMSMQLSKRASVMVGALSLSVALLVPARAGATIGATSRESAPARVEPIQLADVVVNGAQAPAPAPAAPVPVVVQPQAIVPVAEPSRHTTVVEHETHNYMSTIALSALMGGIAGVLVGGSLYYLADNQTHGSRILYWGAGGVLVGTAVGITQIAVQESRVDRATAVRLPTDPAPTFRLALFQTRF